MLVLCAMVCNAVKRLGAPSMRAHRNMQYVCTIKEYSPPQPSLHRPPAASTQQGSVVASACTCTQRGAPGDSAQGGDWMKSGCVRYVWLYGDGRMMLCNALFPRANICMRTCVITPPLLAAPRLHYLHHDHLHHHSHRHDHHHHP